MTVSNGDILKTVYEATLDNGTIVQNVYYHRADFISPETNDVIKALIKTWMEDMYNELTVQLPNGIVQGVCSTDFIEFNATENVWEVVGALGTFLPTIAYNNIEDPLPNQSSAFAVFNTSRPKSRGRKFLPPFAENQQAGTFLISAALTAMAAYAADALADIFVGVLHELVPGVPRAGVDLFLVFTQAIVTDVLGTQRRRRPGVGI